MMEIEAEPILEESRMIERIIDVYWWISVYLVGRAIVPSNLLTVDVEKPINQTRTEQNRDQQLATLVPLVPLLGALQ
jgi:hypothetical protein